MNLPRIDKDGSCIFMTQDIGDTNEYDRAKAIVNFCDKETKLFEKAVDQDILRVFERNGVNVPSTDKSVLKLAFGVLKSKGKTIVVEDTLKDYWKDNSLELVKKTKNKFTIILEDKRYLQCCVSVEERNI